MYKNFNRFFFLRTCKIFDCRTSELGQTWNVQGEVEKVLWNTYNDSQFFASDDKGYVYAFDFRKNKKLWEIQAHTQEVTSNTYVLNLLSIH